MDTVVPVHEVYLHHFMNGHVVVKEVVVVVEVDIAVICPKAVVVQIMVAVDDHQPIQVVLQIVQGDRHIMGTEKAEGNNITHRKVCPTSQCELDRTQFL